MRNLKTTLLSTALLCFAFSSCKDKSVDYESMESDQTLLLFLKNESERISSNGAAECVAAETQAIACASSPGGITAAGYGAAVKSAYSINFSTVSAANICDAYPLSPLYNNADLKTTQAAMKCHFNCYNSFWSRGISSGECSTNATALVTRYSKCLPLVWISSCEAVDDTLFTCLDECLNQGTVFPGP